MIKNKNKKQNLLGKAREADFFMLLTVQVDMEMLNWSAFFAKTKN